MSAVAGISRMNVSGTLVPQAWYWIAHVVFAGVAIGAILRARWSRLASNTQSHLWLGSCVALIAVWSIHPGLLRGIDFHLLGATALTLMFGPHLAILCLALVIAAVAFTGHLAWESFSLNALLLAAFPVGVSHLTLRAAERLLPRNFFIYVFVVAFFGAALAMSVSGLASAGLVALFGTPDAAHMAGQFLPYCLLLGFAEATLTGMVITLMVVYRPHWVGTFDDARYLSRR
jgi:uncharacterized membrane protein